MKKINSLLLLFFIIGSVYSQTPEWYKAEMQRQVGTWVADNKAYMNDQETDDAYAIQWTSGAGGQSLLGVLYGLKNGKKTYDYWQFIQFWDLVEKKVRVIQISAFSPAKGEGFLEQVDSLHTNLVQSFIMPDGKSFVDGHKTEIHPDFEISTSFKIENDNWTKKRSYTWKKQKVPDVNNEYELYLTQISTAEAFLQLKNISTAKHYLEACDVKYRGLEWDFLNKYLDQSLSTLKPDEANRFTAIKLSHDGKLMTVGDSNGTLTIFSYPDFKMLKTLKGHESTITTLDFNNSNTIIASGSRDHKVITWDIIKGVQLFENNSSFSQGVYDLKFSPDNKILGVVSWERTQNDPSVMGFVKILDSKTGKELKKIETEPHPAAGIVFTQMGKNIIVNTWGQMVICYNLDSGKVIWNYNLSNNEEYNNFQDIDLNHDGKTIALSSLDHRVHFLNAENGGLIHKIEPWVGHAKGVKTVKYSPNGKLVATAGEDEIVKIWDTADYSQKQALIGHTGLIDGMEWSKDGKKLYSISSDGTIKSWDLSNPFEVNYDVCVNGPWQMPITNDNSYFAAPCSDEQIGMYNIKTGEAVFTLESRKNLCADISNDGKYLVTAGFDGVVDLWDVQTPKLLNSFKGHTERVDGVVYLDRTKNILSVGDKTLRVWEKDNDKPVFVKDFEMSPFRIISNADESKIFIGFNDGTIKVLNTSNWNEILLFKALTSVNEMTLSPNDQTLAIFSGKLIDIRNANTGGRVFLLDEHKSSGYALDFSPDGKYLISGSFDQTFKLWNLENGKCTLTFHGYQDGIYQAKFVADKELLLGTGNGKIFFYKF
jgi:WD40 repeat protein